MAESLFRRNPVDNFIDILKERRSQLDSPRFMSGKSAQVRNPAYIKLIGTCNMCGGPKGKSKQIPYKEESWNAMYGPKFKSVPVLKSVSIEYGGDWGLAQKITAVIECYTPKDFEEISQYFLMPGNFIDVEFGPAVSDKVWNRSNTKKLKRFRVATFSFSAGSDGSWLGTFTAVSSATAIKNTDMMSLLVNTLKYRSAGKIDGEETTSVKCISELMTADFQRNGNFSVDQLKDGHVLHNGAGDLVDYNPGSTVKFKDAAIAVFTGEHLVSPNDRQSKSMSSYNNTDNTTNTKESTLQVYFTLGYVINRIINDQLMRVAEMSIGSDDKAEFKKLKIQFSDKYSKSIFPSGLRSGDPTAVLILGNNAGNYKSQHGDGKNFEEKLTSPSQVTALSNEIVDIKKILIHQKVIEAAMSSAVSVPSANSDSLDVKNFGEEVVNITDFFKSISSAIHECTGGAISLRLVEDLEEKTDKVELIVVDQNNGGDQPLTCPVLDPIDGDGSTRTCDIQSNVGSEEYRAAMFVGNSKKGDPAAVLRGCDSQMDTARLSIYTKAVKAAIEIVTNPGELGKSYFDGKHIDGLKSAMLTMYKNRPKSNVYDTIHFPGLKINAVIDGTWGILPGCAISTTQLPSGWRSKGVYFMVTGVTHSFDGSDWSTTIDGIMSYYKNLKLVQL